MCLAHHVSNLFLFCPPLLCSHVDGLLLAEDAWEWFAELASLDVLVLVAVLEIGISAAVVFAALELAIV